MAPRAQGEAETPALSNHRGAVVTVPPHWEAWTQKAKEESKLSSFAFVGATAILSGDLFRAVGVSRWESVANSSLRSLLLCGELFT
jgi:hypothetical protein